MSAPPSAGFVGWSQNLVEIRKSLGLTPDGDDEPAIVPSHGFADYYTYVGDEKYRKTLVSLRRVEYRLCSFVAAKSDDEAPTVGVVRPGGQGCVVGVDASDTS
jgi:hypothetical protein